MCWYNLSLYVCITGSALQWSADSVSVGCGATQVSQNLTPRFKPVAQTTQPYHCNLSASQTSFGIHWKKGTLEKKIINWSYTNKQGLQKIRKDVNKKNLLMERTWTNIIIVNSYWRLNIFCEKSSCVMDLLKQFR